MFNLLDVFELLRLPSPGETLSVTVDKHIYMKISYSTSFLFHVKLRLILISFQFHSLAFWRLNSLIYI